MGLQHCLTIKVAQSFCSGMPEAPWRGKVCSYFQVWPSKNMRMLVRSLVLINYLHFKIRLSCIPSNFVFKLLFIYSKIIKLPKLHT